MNGTLRGGASAGSPSHGMTQSHDRGDVGGALGAMSGSTPAENNFPAFDPGRAGGEGAASRAEISPARSLARAALTRAAGAIATALTTPPAASTQGQGGQGGTRQGAVPRAGGNGGGGGRRQQPNPQE